MCAYHGAAVQLDEAIDVISIGGQVLSCTWIRLHPLPLLVFLLGLRTSTPSHTMSSKLCTCRTWLGSSAIAGGFMRASHSAYTKELILNILYITIVRMEWCGCVPPPRQRHSSHTPFHSCPVSAWRYQSVCLLAAWLRFVSIPKSSMGD